MPTGSNFTQHYIDGSRIHGVHCMAELQIGGLRWRQRIGAATTATGGSLGAARHGVLALSPAAESSFLPMLSQLPPARQVLSLCVSTGRLLLGRMCDGQQPAPLLRLGPSASHWKLPASALRLVFVDGCAGHTPARPLRLPWPRDATGLTAQLDSGTTHIALPAALHDQLLPAATRRASLALTLRDGSSAAAGVPVRPPRAPLLHAPARPEALLAPLSHGCRGAEAASATACLRSTAAPVLKTSTQLILGVSFLLHYDVSFFLQDAGFAASVSRSSTAAPVERNTVSGLRAHGVNTHTGDVRQRSKTFCVHRRAQTTDYEYVPRRTD